MKRIFKTVVIVIAVLLVSCVLFGCSESKNIEGHSWKFTLVQDNDGKVIKCSEELSEVYPDVQIADISVLAENGKLIISENEQSIVYGYSVYERSAGTTIYSLEMDGKSCGLASVGITSYADGNREFTLIVTVEDCSVYFVAPTD